MLCVSSKKSLMHISPSSAQVYQSESSVRHAALVSNNHMLNTWVFGLIKKLNNENDNINATFKYI